MNNYEKAKEEGINETANKLWGSLITKEGFEHFLSSFAEKIKEGRDKDLREIIENQCGCKIKMRGVCSLPNDCNRECICHYVNILSSDSQTIKE